MPLMDGGRFAAKPRRFRVPMISFAAVLLQRKFMKEGSKVPRRGNVPKRDVLPDPLYNSELVTRLINNIMLDGKKGVAQKIVYGAFEIVGEKTGKEPLEAFEEAMENIMPQLEGSPCWWCNISGSYGGSSRKTQNLRTQMDHCIQQSKK